jgi:hypothetical protein
MIRKKQAMVLLLIGVMVSSMLLVPFMATNPVFEPVAETPSPVSPTVEEVKDSLVQRLIENRGMETVDPLLAEYMDTLNVPEEVVVGTRGVSVMAFLDTSADVEALRDIVHVKWIFDAKVMSVVSAEVESVDAMSTLSSVKGLRYLMADVYEAPVAGPPTEGDVTLDNFKIRDIVGATAVEGSYTGDGVLVAIEDTGTDFSTPDMIDAIAIDAQGRPMSYDPSGEGMQLMTYANSTNVDNVTEWLANGYLLTYEMGGKYYLNTTGWDPQCTNQPFGDFRNLLGLLPPFGGSSGFPVGYPYGGTVGFIGLYEWAWGIDNGSEFIYNEMFKHWELPAPTANNYSVGWVFAQKSESYAKTFAPALILDSNKLVIDWNGSLAWTLMWNEAFYYEIESLADQTYRDYLTGMMDWSFVDDIDAGYVNTVDNTIPAPNAGPVLAADLDDDGHLDWGLGSLSWVYDDHNYYDKWFNATYNPGWNASATDEALWCGIQPDGLGFYILYASYDQGEHGHWTANALASRGVVDHDVYDNGTLYALPGVAKGAKVIATKYFSSSGATGCHLWTAGLHLNSTGYWVYTGEHQAHIQSMSWGTTSGAYLDNYIWSMFYLALGTPGFIDPAYEGVLYVSSSSNSGPDYMSGGYPATVPSVMSVGASMATHYYDPSYGVQMPYDPAANIQFSSNGPNWLGYSKPDVVAPGYRGVNPTQGHNMYLGIGDSYYWWQGTSLSCPVAAGVAAIALEAMLDNGYTFDPVMLKHIVVSSADARGLDAFREGHGIVNAEAAVDMVTGGVAGFFNSADSWVNYWNTVEDAWVYWMPDWDPGIPVSGWELYAPPEWNETFPAVNLDSIFFGDVARNTAPTLDIMAYTMDGVGGTTQFDHADWDSINAWYYSEYASYTFEVDTFTYDDTAFDPAVERGGHFNLTEEIINSGVLAGDWQTAYTTSEMMTIALHFDAMYAGAIWTRLFYWMDDGPGTLADNGEMNFYNSITLPWGDTYEAADSIKHIARNYDDFNVLHMTAGALGGFPFDTWTPTVMVDDDSPGTTISITVIMWEKVAAPIAAAANGLNTQLTLTVAADAEYGVHQGFVDFVDAVTGFSHSVPYSFMVQVDMPVVAEGTPYTIVDGAGELTPYESGAYLADANPGSSARMDGGGYRTFKLIVPDAGWPTTNATTLVFKATWQHTGTVIDMYLRATTYHLIAQTDDGFAQGASPFDPTPTADKQNTLVWAPGYLVNDTYYLAISCHAANGTDAYEDIKVTVQWHTDLPDPTIDPVWEARDTSGTIASGTTLAGDHVVLKPQWTSTAVPGLPEYDVTHTELQFLSGLYDVQTGPLHVPSSTYDPFSMAFNPSEFTPPVVVKGLVVGDTVRVTVDFTNGDCDIFGFPGDQDPASYSYASNIFGSAMSTGAHPETWTGMWTSSNDTLIMYIFDYDLVPGTYTTYVDTRVSLSYMEEGTTIEFDTYDFLVNNSKDIIVSGYGGTNVMWQVQYLDVYLANFFAPEVELLSPLGGEDWSTGTHRITWTASDTNANDSLWFRIRFSNDGGAFWQILAAGPMSYDAGNGWYYYDWTTTTLLETDEGLIEINAYDNDTVYAGTLDPIYGEEIDVFWPAIRSYDRSDSVFSFGSATIPPPPTPTTTTTPPPTTTTPPPPPPPPPIDPLIIGLIGGIGVGVVVVLILFLVRKR